MYHVLWLDDEWEKMPSFMTVSKEIYEIELVPCKYRKQGIQMLNQNLDKWDAVLLDAKMLEKSDNEVADISGLWNTINKINQLSSKHYLPYFISTGQPDLMDNKMFGTAVGRFYIKERDDDQLFADMLEEIGKAPRKKLEIMYQNVTDAIDSLGLGDQLKDSVFDILEAMHHPADHPDFKPVKNYNSLRQVIEKIFRVCAKYNVVPPQCFNNGNINLTESSKYLAGQDTIHSGVRYGNVGDHILPSYIANIIRSILEVGNIHSHTVDLDEDDQRTIENFFGTMKDNYYIFGLTLQLCEVIMWFDRYLSDPFHQDKERNLSMCVPIGGDDTDKVDQTEAPHIDTGKKGINDYVGVICKPEKDDKGIYHFEACAFNPNYNYGQQQYKIVAVIMNNDYRTKDIYPYFVAKWERI